MPEVSNNKDADNSRLNLKLIVFGLVLFLLVTGGCYFAIRSALAPLVAPGAGQGSQSESVGSLISLGEMTVNISDISMSRFVKTEIVIEVTDEKLKKELESSMMPVIRDEIITILSAKTAADLDSPHRTGLKNEIKTKLNKRFRNGITNVYFNSFIMQ